MREANYCTRITYSYGILSPNERDKIERENSKSLTELEKIALAITKEIAQLALVKQLALAC